MWNQKWPLWYSATHTLSLGFLLSSITRTITIILSHHRHSDTFLTSFSTLPYTAPPPSYILSIALPHSALGLNLNKQSSLCGRSFPCHFLKRMLLPILRLTMVTGNLLGIAAPASKKHSRGCSVCKSAYTPLNYFSLFLFYFVKKIQLQGWSTVNLLIKMHLSDSQWLFIFYYKWGFVHERHSKSWLNRLSFCACYNCRLKICTLKIFLKRINAFLTQFKVPTVSFFIPLIAIQGPVFVQRVPDATIAAAIKPPVCWLNKIVLFFQQPWSQII